MPGLHPMTTTTYPCRVGFAFTNICWRPFCARASPNDNHYLPLQSGVRFPNILFRCPVVGRVPLPFGNHFFRVCVFEGARPSGGLKSAAIFLGVPSDTYPWKVGRANLGGVLGVRWLAVYLVWSGVRLTR